MMMMIFDVNHRVFMHGVYKWRRYIERMGCNVEPTGQASPKTQGAKRHQLCRASRRIISVQESLLNLAFIDEACTHDWLRVLLVNVDGVAAMGQLQCCTNSDTTAAKNGNTHFHNSAASLRKSLL